MILLTVVWFVFLFFPVSRCFKKFRLKVIVCLICCGPLPTLDLRKEYLGGSICTFYKWNLEHSSVLNTSKDDVVKYERISENNIHQQQKVTSVSHLAKQPMISPHSKLLTLSELEAFKFMNSRLSQPLIATPSTVILTGATMCFSKCSKPNLEENVFLLEKKKLILPAISQYHYSSVLYYILQYTEQQLYHMFHWTWIQWGCGDYSFTELWLLWLFSCKSSCISRSKWIAEEKEEQSVAL